jgi:hypothetical protein
VSAGAHHSGGREKLRATDCTALAESFIRFRLPPTDVFFDPTTVR